VVPTGDPMSTGFTHETSVGKSDEWWTPPWLFEALGLRFDLDPCGHEGADVPAHKIYTLAAGQDGLRLPWSGRVFLNPPYSDTTAWVDKLLNSNVTAITLTFARTGSSWAQRLLGGEHCASAVLFLAKRVRFIPGGGQHASSPGADSMLCAFGQTEVEALYRMAEAGHGVMR